MDTFAEYQDAPSSEKEGLLILESSRRLVGWVLHLGSVYKLTSFPHAVLSPDSPLQDSGAALTSAGSALLSAGQYYHDRANGILYLRTSDSVNPSGKFLTVTFRLHFSKGGRNLPHDLVTGFDVHWYPMLKDTSDFGVELDNQNQLGSAIEGSGSVQLFNDQDFWRPIYDKYYFENQRAYVYSWSPALPISEAKLIYKGRVVGKSYTPSQITFKLQDMLAELRAPVSLAFLQAVAGVRIPDSLNLAFQRRLYGYVQGHRPTNIDQVLSGFAITGTVAATSGSATITGTGTAFLSQLSPDDELTIFGDTPVTYSVLAVASNTSATLTEVYVADTASGLSSTLKPSRPTRLRNRVFLIAGHALSEPQTTVVSGATTSQFDVVDATDLIPGDALTVAGENTTVVRVSGNTVKISTSLIARPELGDAVTRQAVTNVYLGERSLTLTTDYTYDASAGTITLSPLAEFNVAPVRGVKGTMAFTSTSRNVVGTGTSFTADIQPGDWVKRSTQADYFEVLSVTDDLNLVIRTAATYTSSGAALVKRPEYFDDGNSILSCDVTGKTVDGLTTGALLRTAPEIVEDLLTSAGLSSLINTASFTAAKELTVKRLGLVIPKRLGDTKAQTLRDVINEVNKSDFGSLIQNEDFELEYHIVSPGKPSSTTRFTESDALSFAIESSSDRIVKTVRVNYAFRETDPVSKAGINSQATKTSNSSQYLARATAEKVFDTLLADETDAQIYANRWSFLFEVASSIVKLGTKLQGSRLQIGDTVELSHEKLYERVGSAAGRKVAAVSRVKKSLEDSSVELDDLSNAFSRVAVITENTAEPYVDATERERAVSGYITDNFGMQGNDADTFGVNLIW